MAAEMVGPRLYSCWNCRNHVALHDDCISKAFQKYKEAKEEIKQYATRERSERSEVVGKLFGVFKMGRNGRAFLFSHAMNVSLGAKEDRQLMTGLHTVADVFCSDCRELLGWKYERAYEETQKYKEGKVILEKSKIVKENW